MLDPETARAALLAGAEYIVGPGLNLEVIRLCRRYGKVVMPGALTPTEVITAWEAGADVVKIFPSDLGGPFLSQGASSPPAPDPNDANRRGRPCQPPRRSSRPAPAAWGWEARWSRPRPSPRVTSPGSATSPGNSPGLSGSTARPRAIEAPSRQIRLNRDVRPNRFKPSTDRRR